MSDRRLAAAAVVAAALACQPSPDAPLPSPAPPGSLVRTGLERVEAGEVPSLTGRRIGLVVHAASVTTGGTHAIDVFRNRNLELIRLFSPEHGLAGRAAAGQPVASDRDPMSGLPVVSLYGDKRAPEAADLAELDVLVFDLQGAGVRFYTYVSTMILCLRAAAEAGLPFVVLDRPNPLGGERIEGPLAAPRDVVPESFVNLAPGPLVHGLTMGEMARHVNATLARPAALEVVAMTGWHRAMTWSDTGRPWVPPSPNLRSADAALAYPGTALLEATSMSEGRGTPAPFLWIGAPWLGDRELPTAIAGFRLAPHRFTPATSAAAPTPKHLGEECRGWRIEVADRAVAEPYRLGVTLLHRLHRQPGFEWRREGQALSWLVGTPRLLEQLSAGAGVEEVVGADRGDHEAWREQRRPALLY